MKIARSAFTLIIPAIALFDARGSAAQSGSQRASSAHACSLVTVAEIRKITGQQGYDNSPDANEGSDVAGGGSACRFEAGFTTPPPRPPVVDIVLIQGRKYTQGQRTMKLPAGCVFETVRGVGDDAFYWHCSKPRVYRSPLYVKKGANDLIVQVQVRSSGAPVAEIPILLAVAKAAVAKLR